MQKKYFDDRYQQQQICLTLEYDRHDPLFQVIKLKKFLMDGNEATAVLEKIVIEKLPTLKKFQWDVATETIEDQASGFYLFLGFADDDDDYLDVQTNCSYSQKHSF
ncbi:L-seryl-tRNA(Sec) selenium transferase [Trichinella pseudospiralis]